MDSIELYIYIYLLSNTLLVGFWLIRKQLIARHDKQIAKKLRKMNDELKLDYIYNYFNL